MSATKKVIKEEVRLDGYRNYNKLLTDIQNKYGTEDVQIKKEEYKKGFLFKKKYYGAIVRILEEDTQQENEEQKKLISELMKELKEIKTELNSKKEKDDNSTILKQMREDMRTLTNTIDVMKDSSNYPLEVRNLEKFLKQQNVEENTIHKIIKGVIYDCSNEELKDSYKVFKAAKKQTSQLFSNIKALNFNSTKQIVMLVGPTGVGKTTTITKLSTYLKQVKRKDVGLITLDTYREGAIAQLRDLCDYSNIEVEVANTKSDFENCLKKFSMKDFIFIDTAGRSQYDLSEIRKLYMTTDNGNIDDVCLVMSSSTKYKDMLEIYNSYKDLGVNKIIFSKIDETKEYGNLLSLVDTIDVPLAYLTTGQEVPNDIEKARESKLTELIFKNEDSLDFM